MLRWTVHQINGFCTFCTAVLPVGNELYCFGGGAQVIGVNVFNTVALLWRKSPHGRGQCPLEVPSWHYYHTGVLVGDIVYIWGGWTYAGLCNKLYAFDVDAHTWSKPRVCGTVPEGRYRHSACVIGKVMFIHGGETQTGWTNDIYKLGTTTMVWSLINTIGTPPPAAGGHSATNIGTKMFVFGGQHYNTIRVFDTETDQCMNTPSTQPLPERRWGHSAFTSNGELYIIGGAGRTGNLNDLWKFNPETFSWKEVKPKGNGPSRMTDCCCCIVGDRIIHFGGYPDYELFVLDLSPSLKMLCKLAVIQYDLDQSELPHDIRWELAAMMKK